MGVRALGVLGVPAGRRAGGEGTGDHPFDLEKLEQRSRQVRELCTFIYGAWRPEPKPILATAVDWF